MSYSFVKFLTVNDSKKILIDPMIPLYIFISVPKRSTTHSKKNHDHTTHKSEDIERNIGVAGKHIIFKVLGSAQESKNVVHKLFFHEMFYFKRL